MVCECLWAMISNTHKSTGNLKKTNQNQHKIYTRIWTFFFLFIKIWNCWVHVWRFLSELFTFFEVVCLQLSLNKQGAKLCIKHKWEAAQLNQKRCPHRTLHIDMVKQMIYLVICLKLVELKHKFHILSDKFIRQQEASDTHNSAIN